MMVRLMIMFVVRFFLVAGMLHSVLHLMQVFVTGQVHGELDGQHAQQYVVDGQPRITVAGPVPGRERNSSAAHILETQYVLAEVLRQTSHGHILERRLRKTHLLLWVEWASVISNKRSSTPPSPHPKIFLFASASSVNSFKFQPCDHTPPGTRRLEVSGAARGVIRGDAL
eukprot:TRINITY_DN578_c0_g1_i1.p1 TRINITY_DN578_c0_g1~~TRINITY_DN578_c0_g1_i1.p1  ORF type:complete len:170 (-),score=6.02 TRINITY_DN578_c0_g1_i1:14-523(-)